MKSDARPVVPQGNPLRSVRAGYSRELWGCPWPLVISLVGSYPRADQVPLKHRVVW